MKSHRNTPSMYPSVISTSITVMLTCGIRQRKAKMRHAARMPLARRWAMGRTGRCTPVAFSWSATFSSCVLLGSVEGVRRSACLRFQAQYTEKILAKVATPMKLPTRNQSWCGYSY